MFFRQIFWYILSRYGEDVPIRILTPLLLPYQLLLSPKLSNLFTLRIYLLFNIYSIFLTYFTSSLPTLSFLPTSPSSPFIFCFNVLGHCCCRRMCAQPSVNLGNGARQIPWLVIDFSISCSHRDIDRYDFIVLEFISVWIYVDTNFNICLLYYSNFIKCRIPHLPQVPHEGSAYCASEMASHLLQIRGLSLSLLHIYP